ncbi:alpha/beta fold hydrolase [Gemmatimonas aurantiaca]|uniref:alpha/beta fold hydrolase n=1 Tax=Gemmatimonas aurantiaca TaxID=173480 RepID=UPI00301DB768
MTESIPASLRIVRRANRTLGRVAPSLAARLNQRLFSTPRRHAPRDWELALEAAGRRRRLAGGLSVLEAGDGPTVALIHGWEGRATQFAAFVPRLLDAGYHVVAIDGPAHGHSRGRRADPYRFADALRVVADTFGPLHGAVGHSMGGGSIAIALAAGLEARRVVSIASPASLRDVIDRYAEVMQLPPQATSQFRERFHRHIVQSGHRPVDVLELLRDVTTDALVIHARDDREVPFDHGERIVAHWQRARLMPVEGLGHRRILRDPAVIEAAVAFLRGTQEQEAR